MFSDRKKRITGRLRRLLEKPEPRSGIDIPGRDLRDAALRESYARLEEQRCRLNVPPPKFRAYRGVTRIEALAMGLILLMVVFLLARWTAPTYAPELPSVVGTQE